MRYGAHLGRLARGVGLLVLLPLPLLLDRFPA